MTQQHLADELGVSLRTVGSWERGETVPRNRLAPLAEVLQLSEMPEFGNEALLRRLGQLSKQRREELGLSRVSFAKEAGLGSDRTLREFEFGKSMPNSRSRMLIEKGLGWRLGVIEDMLRMTNRKASSIDMTELDAEDSMTLASRGPQSLALVPSAELLAELGRRLGVGTELPADLQHLYGLAASTNSEHLEGDEE